MLCLNKFRISDIVRTHFNPSGIPNSLILAA